ncbi:MAG: HD domain-containing phosphohydrolase [Thermoleophilaceae bacterium]
MATVRRQPAGRRLLVAGLLSLIALGTLLAYQVHLDGRTREILDQRFEVARNFERIRYYGEALTMSARLAVASGDRAAERRHAQLVPALGALIGGSRRLIDDPGADRALTRMDDIRATLLRTERRALRVVRGDGERTALALLMSPGYRRQKDAYVAASETAVDRYTSTSRAELGTSAGLRRFTGILALLMGASAVGFFTALTRVAVSYRQRAGQAQEAARLAFERRRAERALRETEERFRRIAAQAPMVLWAFDRDGTFTLSEGERLRAIGLAPGEVVGRSVFDVYRHQPQLLDNVRRALAGEEHSALNEVNGLCFDTMYSPLRDADGEVVSVVGVSTDVTERMRAEGERDRLEREALRDSLTGLANHRAFHEDLARHLDARRSDDAPVGVVLLDVDGLKRVNDTLGLQAGDARLRAVARAVRQVTPEGAEAYRVGGDEFAIVTSGQGAWAALGVVHRLRAALLAGEEDGAPAPPGPHGEPPTVTAGIAEAVGDEGKDTILRRADLALIEAKGSHRDAIIWTEDIREPTELEPDATIRRRHEQTLATALARAVDAKDSYTRSHCETVSEICALMARALGLEPERIDRLRLAGLLHDVGKIGIADAILQKRGPLNDAEFEVMKTHTTLGHRILEGAELDLEGEWVLHHHERLDGTGYPDGLAGAEVPLESRIILVADAFEAITADRPYRSGRSDVEALEELERHSGTQFDAACVAALRAALAGAAPSDAGPATAGARSDAREHPASAVHPASSADSTPGVRPTPAERAVLAEHTMAGHRPTAPNGASHAPAAGSRTPTPSGADPLARAVDGLGRLGRRWRAGRR